MPPPLLALIELGNIHISRQGVDLLSLHQLHFDLEEAGELKVIGYKIPLYVLQIQYTHTNQVVASTNQVLDILDSQHNSTPIGDL